jgi:hypothetical protein
MSIINNVSSYIYFKLVYQNSIKILIPNDVKINELNVFIKQQIIQNYNITEYDIIESNKREHGEPIVECNNYFYDVYNKNSAFYIRPKNYRQCIICLNNKNINEFKIMNCNHNIFCNLCITTWQRTNSSCPICREVIV